MWKCFERINPIYCISLWIIKDIFKHLCPLCQNSQNWWIFSSELPIVNLLLREWFNSIWYFFSNMVILVPWRIIFNSVLINPIKKVNIIILIIIAPTKPIFLFLFILNSILKFVLILLCHPKQFFIKTNKTFKICRLLNVRFNRLTWKINNSVYHFHYIFSVVTTAFLLYCQILGHQKIHKLVVTSVNGQKSLFHFGSCACWWCLGVIRS